MVVLDSPLVVAAAPVLQAILHLLLTFAVRFWYHTWQLVELLCDGESRSQQSRCTGLEYGTLLDRCEHKLRVPTPYHLQYFNFAMCPVSYGIIAGAFYQYLIVNDLEC